MVTLSVDPALADGIPKSLQALRTYQRIIGSVRSLTPMLPQHISIALIDDEAMRAINKKSRKIDRVTDVLSFLYGPTEGELLVCVPQAMRQFRRFRSSSVLHEMKRLVIHGALHLAGYDHIRAKDKKVMEALAKKALTKIT